MAKTGKERSARTAAKWIEYDEKELRHRLRLGTRQKPEELMTWNDIEEIAEAIQNLILNVHVLGPPLFHQAIECPRHKIKVSENVARIIHNTGRHKASRLNADSVATKMVTCVKNATQERLIYD